MESQVIIRYILAALLIFGVYTETGIWTALALVLIVLNLDMDF